MEKKEKTTEKAQKKTVKREKTVGKITSSGQEKVENIALRAQAKAEQASGGLPSAEKTEKMEKSVKSVKETPKSHSAPSKSAPKTAHKTALNAVMVGENSRLEKKTEWEIQARKQEEDKKQKRVIAALKKEEEKAKKQAKRAEKKAERAKLRAAAKERREERLKLRRQKAEEERKKRLEKMKETKAAIEKKRAERAQKAALIQKETHEDRVARLKAEREAKRAAQAKRLAEEKQKRQERRAAKAQNRAQKQAEKRRERENGREKNRTPGFGGWLAAVISLGALSLALASVVTVGAIDMRAMGRTAMSGYRANLYELVGIVDEVDADLNKARVSATPTGQSLILTDLVVQARLAESNLEKFPVDMESELRLTEFLNRTANEAERMLSKLRLGEPLSEKDIQTIEYLYAINRGVKEELNGLVGKLSDDTMSAFIKEKADNAIFESFQKLENIATGEGMEKQPPRPQPRQEKKDGNSQPNEITVEEGKEACARYFKDYGIVKIEEAGETTSGRLDTLNFFLTDGQERQYFAQISKSDGALVEFDFYEKCTEKRLDTERAKEVAERYLQALGYRDMTAVWVNEGGLQATFLFAYDADGTVYYPDTVQVKVCQEKGIVIGLNARAYLIHHRARQTDETVISLASAREKISDKLTVESVTLAVIPTRGRGERTTYEFLCSYDGNLYFVYLDARTGEEVDILGADELTEGRRLY